MVVKRAIPTEAGVRGSHSLFLVETENQGITATRKLLHVGHVPAPSHIANRLGITGGDETVVRRRLMLANGIPVRISSSWFTVEVARETGLYEPDFIPQGLQVLFEGFGYRFGRALETLVARPSSAEESELLEIAHNSPVVHILRTSYDARNRHVHSLESICAAERHVFDVRQAEGDGVF